MSYNKLMTPKKLYRSRKNSMLAGVLGGLAEYFSHDATFWRLGFAVFLVVTGFFPGIILYVIAWIIMPLAPDVEFAVLNEDEQ